MASASGSKLCGADGKPSGLHSAKSTRRLEQIASLRARGIGDHIDLPQLVVCGDQSAGKSSVLEGLTEIPFPRQDGVCTKFATEIILQHTEGERNITCTIIPHHARSNKSKEELQRFRQRLSSFDELPELIGKAGALMGIRGFNQKVDGPGFTEDILRIEFSGPTGLHLSVVDLPGIFTTPSEEQSEDDPQTVSNLVDSYIKNPRTIILAVIQAGNDIANQSIIKRSRRFDKQGQRTVGIITKPDLINKGTEGRIALLAKNLDTTKLGLGYFILKNPTPEQLKNGISSEERQSMEANFFQSTPWQEQALIPDRVGIANLKSYLQKLLDQHIEKELPKVLRDIVSLRGRTATEIASLGEARTTTVELRAYLIRLATRFHDLVISALNGTYHEGDSDFFSESDTDGRLTRLRALVHRSNTKFSDYMRKRGQKRKVLRTTNANGDEPDHDDDEYGLVQPSETSESDVDDSAEQDSIEQNLLDPIENAQLIVSKKEIIEWIKRVYVSSRGKELPGNYNHILLSQLFFAQSSRWLGIAENHLASVYDNISTFVELALFTVVKDDHVRGMLSNLVNDRLMDHRSGAEEELRRLAEDEKQQPITYNYYFTTNVQKSRMLSVKALMGQAITDSKVTIQKYDKEEDDYSDMEIADDDKLFASLQDKLCVDMDKQACAEALTGLNAYYKVARKTFVDNVCRQVIERRLLRMLPSIFSPDTVASLDEEDLNRIAGEQPINIERRRQLQDNLTKLNESLRDLRK